MHRSGYRLPKDTKSYLLRRLIRIDPPYFFASAGSALLWYLASLASGFRGSPPNISWAASLAHVGYLNGVLGFPWYAPASWTLGIEFQFYLLAAVALPLCVVRSGAFLLPALIANVLTLLGVHYGMVAEAQANSAAILTWIPLFLIGVSAFRRFSKLSANGEFLVVQMTSAATGMLVGRPAGVAAAVLSALLLAYGRIDLPKTLAAYASITYSLYLVHGPIGTRVVRLVQRLGDTPGVDILSVFAGTVASLVAAVIFWHSVERPALRWASALKTRTT